MAAVTVVDVVDLVPSPLFAFAGLAWLVATGNWAPAFPVVAISLLGVSMALVVVGGLAWRSWIEVGRTIARFSVGTVATANRETGRVMTDGGAPVDVRWNRGTVIVSVEYTPASIDG